MGKGKTYKDTQFRYFDSYSEREVVQLTDYLGHSNHIYFTDPCWFNEGRSFIFTSHRENRGNLFRYDLDTGLITQMTDLDGRGGGGSCVSEANNAVYYGWRGAIRELKLNTLEERVIWHVAAPMRLYGAAKPTADGKYVCIMLMEQRQKEKQRISFSYSDFDELYALKPLMQIMRIDVATGAAEVIHEDRCYLGHVNTSPTLPDILTFCHEGPWQVIDQRIWGLNIKSGEKWKIRPQEGEYSVGHEYWFADGERIGYHGSSRADGGQYLCGYVRWDNSECVEDHFPFHSDHFHSLDEKLIVGDGTPASVRSTRGKAEPFIQLFKWDGDHYIGPKILALHRSTANDQYAHPHPRFTPDGRAVLYTSDLTGYANMYLVEVGEFEELPDLT